jgi:hypothetical protein
MISAVSWRCMMSTPVDPANMWRWAIANGTLSVDSRDPVAFYRRLAEHYLDAERLAEWQRTALLERCTVLRLEPPTGANHGVPWGLASEHAAMGFQYADTGRHLWGSAVAMESTFRRVTLHATASVAPTGHIGLQAHHPGSWGQFCNVRIRE